MRQIEPRLHTWSIRMEGYGGSAQPSPTIEQCLSGGLGWLEVECNRCKTRASLPLEASNGKSMALELLRTLLLSLRRIAGYGKRK